MDPSSSGAGIGEIPLLMLSGCKSFEELKLDPYLKQFLANDWTPEGPVHREDVPIDDQISKVTHGLHVLNTDIRELVVGRSDNLLAEATKIYTLEKALRSLQEKADVLMKTMDTIKNRIAEPFNRYSQKLIVLRRLQTTCDLLRKVIRVIHLGDRLHDFDIEDTDSNTGNIESGSTKGRELIKAAQHLNELECLFEEEKDLKQIEIIQQDFEVLQEKKPKMVSLANKILDTGLKNQDQAILGTALQIFFSLRQLNERVTTFMKSLKDEINQAIHKALDIQAATGGSQTRGASGPGRVQMSITVGQTASFRNALWKNLDSVLEKTYMGVVQISLIYRILKKRRDPLSNKLFIDTMEIKDGVTMFWTSTTKSICEEMCKASSKTSTLKLALEGEYPKLLKAFSELWKRVNREEKSLNAEKTLRASLQPFEAAYLSRSVSHLFDSLGMIFSDAKESALRSSGDQTQNKLPAPSAQDVDSLVKTISDQINVSNIDPYLNRSMAKNVAKTVNLFAVKCEQLVSVSGDATQVIGPATASQHLNATLVHRLESFHKQMKKMIDGPSSSTPEATAIIEESLTALHNLTSTITSPLVQSITDSVEAIILTAHGEDFSASVVPAEVRPSLYMRELQSFLTRVNKDYLSLYPDCHAVHDSMYNMASRTIDLFLRHATLIRPLGEGGKARLSVDVTQLESSLDPFCQKVADLGRSYKALRSFKSLLYQEPQAIAASPLVGDLIPYSITIQFLICCFGPRELKSPHENLSWSISRYNNWMDQHSNEHERLKLISGTIDSYVKTVQNQHGKTFHFVYPLIVDLLQKGLHASS